MVKTKEEIMESIKNKFADDTSDETLAFIEDVSDTFDSMKDSENWKEKYEENDRTWREKYKNRFFNPATKEDDEFIKEFEEEREEEFKPKKYSDLFVMEKEDNMSMKEGNRYV